MSDLVFLGIVINYFITSYEINTSYTYILSSMFFVWYGTKKVYHVSMFNGIVATVILNWTM